MSDSIHTSTNSSGALARFWHSLLEGMTPPAQPTLDKSTSLRIRVARPMCIFFMVWVHINPGTAEFSPLTHGITMADWYRFFFADGVGRTSIGLLAIVSGFLAISTGRVFPYGTFVGKRIKSLVIPMVAWSAILLLAYIAGEAVKPGYLEHQVGEAFSWGHIPNWLFGITDHPANFPLGFLRDLFLCALLTPVLVLAMRKAAIPVLAVLFIMMVTHVKSPFLGNNIPLFYSIGIWLALNGKSMEDFIDRHAGKVIIAFLTYAALLTAFRFQTELHPEHHLVPVFYGFMEVQRLFGAAAFWAIAGMISRRKWVSLVTRFEPYAFFVFCSHIIISTVYWIPYQYLVGGYYHPTYPLFFSITPVFVYVSAVLSALFLAKFLRPVSTVLNGGRPLPAAGLMDLLRRADSAPKPPKEAVGSKSVFN